MAHLRTGLVATSPVGPAEPVGRVVDSLGNEGDEQAGDLVAGERDQLVLGGLAGVFVRADDGEEGVGEHGEGYPARPGRVTADLVFVQSGQALPDWNVSSTRHLDPATRTKVASGTGLGE